MTHLQRLDQLAVVVTGPPMLITLNYSGFFQIICTYRDAANEITLYSSVCR